MWSTEPHRIKHTTRTQQWQLQHQRQTKQQQQQQWYQRRQEKKGEHRNEKLKLDIGIRRPKYGHGEMVSMFFPAAHVSVYVSLQRCSAPSACHAMPQPGPTVSFRFYILCVCVGGVCVIHTFCFIIFVHKYHKDAVRQAERQAVWVLRQKPTDAYRRCPTFARQRHRKKAQKNRKIKVKNKSLKRIE